MHSTYSSSWIFTLYLIPIAARLHAFATSQVPWADTPHTTSYLTYTALPTSIRNTNVSVPILHASRSFPAPTSPTRRHQAPISSHSRPPVAEEQRQKNMKQPRAVGLLVASPPALLARLEATQSIGAKMI